MKPWLSLALPILLAGCAASGGSGTPSTAVLDRATLGLETAAPSAQTAEDMDLTFNVRWQGQVVRSVEPGGAADKAGLKPGDVLLRLADNELYSQDDLRDYLAVADPGSRTTAVVKRAKTKESEEVSLTLGERQVTVATPHLEWQYAGLGQLPRALEEARAAKKKVMVGLSGAET